jgi:hypothetical protein
MRQMNEWQQIDTAPKDGTWILLFSPENGMKMAICTWERMSYNWPLQWVFGPKDTHGFRNGFYGATHWMPLPAPPHGGCTT